MWLLSTSRAELHYFIGPEAVPGGYAILSHVWEVEEQTFSEVQALQRMCSESGANPRNHASEKIRRFCELAEAHGHEWGWADTCCIDKSSSSELSEAINSMYRYYSMAEVCYAYLFDVPTGDLHEGSQDPGNLSGGLKTGDAFARSQWHKRGWTLQELLAPDVVVFVSQEWVILGAKADYPNLLYNITGIPYGVLTLVNDPAELGIAQRMSWAANRETRRPEDEAYCLMGIFDVNMPILYGEGRRAFRRLQEEIMKKSVDTSLFAWHRRLSREDELLFRQWAIAAPAGRCPLDHTTKVNLFAESPADFNRASSVTYHGPRYSGINYVSSQRCSADPSWVHSPRRQDSRLKLLNLSVAERPTFTITPNGVLASIMVLRVGSHVYAMLLCCDRPLESHSDPSTNIILLSLVPCGEAHVRELPLQVYHAIGLRFISSYAELYRGTEIDGRIEDIYIVHEPSQPRREHPGAVNASLVSPFRVSPSTLLQEVKSAGIVAITHSRLPQPWGGIEPLRLRFQGSAAASHPATQNVHISASPWHFTVTLGCCTILSGPNVSAASRVRWANVVRGTPAGATGNDRDLAMPGRSRPEDNWQGWFETHNCATDHIEDWPDHSKVYPGIINYQLDEGADDLRRVGDVRLSFTRSLFPAVGADPLELHVQILDSIRYTVPPESDTVPATGTGIDQVAHSESVRSGDSLQSVALADRDNSTVSSSSSSTLGRLRKGTRSLLSLKASKSKFRSLTS